MLKMRYELNPKYYQFQDCNSATEQANELSKSEADATQLVGDFGHAPKFETYCRQVQGSGMLYQGPPSTL